MKKALFIVAVLLWAWAIVACGEAVDIGDYSNSTVVEEKDDSEEESDSDSGIELDGEPGNCECVLNSGFPCACDAQQCDDGSLCDKIPMGTGSYCMASCNGMGDSACSDTNGCGYFGACVFTTEQGLEEPNACVLICDEGSCPIGLKCVKTSASSLCM